MTNTRLAAAVVVTIALFLVGIAASVVAGWVKKPTWMTPRLAVAALLGLVVAGGLLTVLASPDNLLTGGQASPVSTGSTAAVPGTSRTYATTATQTGSLSGTSRPAVSATQTVSVGLSSSPDSGNGGGPYPLVPPGYPVTLTATPGTLSFGANTVVHLDLEGVADGELVRDDWLRPPDSDAVVVCSPYSGRCGKLRTSSNSYAFSKDQGITGYFGANDPKGVYAIYVDLIDRQLTVKTEIVVS